MSAIPPNDTQCRADVDGSRCENEIAFSMVDKSWSQMCEGHTKQNDLARVNKAPKVLKFAGASKE